MERSRFISGCFCYGQLKSGFPLNSESFYKKKKTKEINWKITEQLKEPFKNQTTVCWTVRGNERLIDHTTFRHSLMLNFREKEKKKSQIMVVTLTDKIGLESFFNKCFHKVSSTVVLASNLTPVKVFITFKHPWLILKERNKSEDK